MLRSFSALHHILHKCTSFNFVLFLFELYAFIILTSTLVLGIIVRSC